MSEALLKKLPFNGHDSPPTLGVWPTSGKKLLTLIIEESEGLGDEEDGDSGQRKNGENHVE
ncbi:MAG: hypothetical protein WC582_03210 [Patescibacteria group bacterium]|jgi:hypothetical protein